MDEQIKEFMQSGKYDEAIKALNELIADNLEDDALVLSLSISFIENNQLIEGKKALDYFHKLSKPTDESMEALGVYWFKMGHKQKALISFYCALEINLENGNVHRNISMIYELLHDFEKAEYHLTQAALFQPDNYLTQIAMAHIYIKHDDIEKAAYMLENILMSGISIPEDKLEYIQSLLKEIYDNI